MINKIDEENAKESIDDKITESEESKISGSTLKPKLSCKCSSNHHYPSEQQSQWKDWTTLDKDEIWLGMNLIL